MWLRFTADFNFKPSPAVTISYRAGMTKNVTRACAAAAVAAAKAEPTERPPGRVPYGRS
jgi:hypothetical protein